VLNGAAILIGIAAHIPHLIPDVPDGALLVTISSRSMRRMAGNKCSPLKVCGLIRAVVTVIMIVLIVPNIIECRCIGVNATSMAGK
jgi:hypothetical protein